MCFQNIGGKDISGAVFYKVLNNECFPTSDVWLRLWKSSLIVEAHNIPEQKGNLLN